MVNMIELSEIKRLIDIEKLSFREISRRTGLSRSTISKWYYSKEYPKYERIKVSRPQHNKVVSYLKTWVAEDICSIKKRKLSRIRSATVMWHDLLALGIEVGESTVRRFMLMK